MTDKFSPMLTLLLWFPDDGGGKGGGGGGKRKRRPGKSVEEGEEGEEQEEEEEGLPRTAPYNASTCGIKDVAEKQPRIVGGYEATKGSWPWQVRRGRGGREKGEDGEVVIEEKGGEKEK